MLFNLPELRYLGSDNVNGVWFLLWRKFLQHLTSIMDRKKCINGQGRERAPAKDKWGPQPVSVSWRRWLQAGSWRQLVLWGGGSHSEPQEKLKQKSKQAALISDRREFMASSTYKNPSYHSHISNNPSASTLFLLNPGQKQMLLVCEFPVHGLMKNSYLKNITYYL